MGSGIKLCENLGSEKRFRQLYLWVQYPIWLCGSVHISVNVLRRVAAKISSPHCNKRYHLAIFKSLTYTNHWCWLHKYTHYVNAKFISLHCHKRKRLKTRV